MSNEEDIQRKGKMLISRSKGKNVCVCVCVYARVRTHMYVGGSRGFDKIQASRFLHFVC